MMRNVYLEGEMGEKFGTGFQVSAPKVADIVKCIDCNHPYFRKYLIDCHEQDIGFEVDIAKQKLDYEAEMLMNLQEGDVTITPIPAGSKSGGAKIFAAVAILAVMVMSGGAAGGLLSLGQTATTGMTTLGGGTGSIFTSVIQSGAAAGTIGLSNVGMMSVMLAVNVGMMGLSQLMAPDPATDADQEESYLFNGNQQNIVEGDPVPVLYGRLRVPGQPINFEVSGSGTQPARSTFMHQSGETNLGFI